MPARHPYKSTINEVFSEMARNAAWEQFKKMPSSNPGDYARAIMRALEPEIDHVLAGGGYGE